MSSHVGPPASGQRDLASALRLLQQLPPAMARADRARQVAIVQELVRLRAPLGPQWQQLAQVALATGEVALALEVAKIHVSHENGAPLALCLKAAVLEQAGRLVEAREVMGQVPRHIPTPAAHAFGLGTSALHLGLAEEARGQLAEAVRLDPGNGFAWLSLGMVSDLKDDDALADDMLAAAPHTRRAAPVLQAAWLYALGNLFHARTEHGRAFASFADGAALMRRVDPFDRAADLRSIDQALAGHTPAGLVEAAHQAGERANRTLPNRTIFVTGLPRSGTTLVEQILASHSAVAGGAELSLLPLIAQESRGADAAALARADIPALAHLWDHLLAQRFPGTGLVVDKSLNTSRFLGLAAAVAPQAPVVWVQRDPLDCGWSAFRTFFPQSLSWTYDLADIAWHVRHEGQVMARWQDLLGERLLVLPYEELVTDPKSWIPRLLAHCGLAVEPQVFTPHLAQRSVVTASAAQVRQPINRAGIGSAEPYRRLLDPLVRGLR